MDFRPGLDDALHCDGDRSVDHVAAANTPYARFALVLFFVQLTLNVAWPAFFFTLRSPELAAFEIVVLWLSIAATVVIFFRIARIAALLMAVYLGWVTFAAALTFSIWRLNG